MEEVSAHAFGEDHCLVVVQIVAQSAIFLMILMQGLLVFNHFFHQKFINCLLVRTRVLFFLHDDVVEYLTNANGALVDLVPLGMTVLGPRGVVELQRRDLPPLSDILDL